jgi:hypothetical protein
MIEWKEYNKIIDEITMNNTVLTIALSYTILCGDGHRGLRPKCDWSHKIKAHCLFQTRIRIKRFLIIKLFLVRNELLKILLFNEKITLKPLMK